MVGICNHRLTLGIPLDLVWVNDPFYGFHGPAGFGGRGDADPDLDPALVAAPADLAGGGECFIASFEVDQAGFRFWRHFNPPWLCPAGRFRRL